MTTRLITCIASICLLSSFAVRAAEHEKHAAPVDISKLPPPAARTGVTYESDIKPIFDKSCIDCHGEKRAKAKLRLDSLPGVLKGSEDGKVVKPGDSAHSVLVHNVAHAGDPDNYMPPPKNKAGIPPLTAEQIGSIRAWIDQGVK